MAYASHLPKLSPNLISALASLDVDNFAHTSFRNVQIRLSKSHGILFISELVESTPN